MLKERVIFNKLKIFYSILNYTIADFTPSGNLCHMNKYGEKLYITPLKEVFNLRWYIQHLMDENKDEAVNSFSEQIWMMRTNWKFIKFGIHHKLSMTSEKLKQKLFEEMIKNGHEKLDTDEEESNEEEQESTTSSEKSEQDSESDTSTEDEEESNKIQTLQVHHGMNEATHDEESSSEPEDDTSEENSVYEIQSHSVIGEQNNIQEDKLLTTKVKVEIQKVEGPITYSKDKHIFKFKVVSGSSQEVWGVCIDFQSILSKWTIDAILQHMVSM